MAYLTKKHFEMIAKIFRTERGRALSRGQFDTDRAIRKLQDDVSVMLSDLNPAFSHDRFRGACDPRENHL